MTLRRAAATIFSASASTADGGRIRLLKRLWLLLWPGLLALHLFPIRSRLERQLMLVTFVLLCLGGTALFWKRWWVRVLGAGIGAGLAAVALLPGRPADPQTLRAEYLRSLKSYEGTVYVWGGEAATGIDCSGLVRVGMVDALMRTGVSEMNPALIRQAFALWRRDCPAQELGRGYGGRLRLVTETRSINELDHRLLWPGDIAVTASGQHTMAYLGGSRWIEADPGPMRVITATAPGKLPWFDMPMRVLRWEVLAGMNANDGAEQP